MLCMCNCKGWSCFQHAAAWREANIKDAWLTATAVRLVLMLLSSQLIQKRLSLHRGDVNGQGQHLIWAFKSTEISMGKSSARNDKTQALVGHDFLSWTDLLMVTKVVHHAWHCHLKLEVARYLVKKGAQLKQTLHMHWKHRWHRPRTSGRQVL